MENREIEIYFNNQNVIDQLLRQLEKDLSLEFDSLLCQLDKENLFQKLHNLILPIVEINIKQDYSNFMNKLYCIDVSEQKINQMLQNKSSSDYADIITDLILQKEMQKIITRLVYANWNNTSN
jgi:hypothetical protein